MELVSRFLFKRLYGFQKGKKSLLYNIVKRNAMSGARFLILYVEAETAAFYNTLVIRPQPVKRFPFSRLIGGGFLFVRPCFAHGLTAPFQNKKGDGWGFFPSRPLFLCPLFFHWG